MVVTCKGCGTPFTWSQSKARAMWAPNCTCKQVRTRLREEGCPECGEHMIMLEKDEIGYIATCADCDELWEVNDNEENNDS